MWRLKIAEWGGDPWLRTTNGHVGRQVWEFDAAAEPDPAVDAARRAFVERRHDLKHSADLLMRLQVRNRWPATTSNACDPRRPSLGPPPRSRGCGWACMSPSRSANRASGVVAWSGSAARSTRKGGGDGVTDVLLLLGRFSWGRRDGTYPSTSASFQCGADETKLVFLGFSMILMRGV